MPPVNHPQPQRGQPSAPTPANNAMAETAARLLHADRYPCIICHEHFADTTGRALHIQAVHGLEDGFLCHECPKTFSDREQYNRHNRDHSNTRISLSQDRPCRHLHCSLRAYSQDVLDRHLRDDHLANGAPRRQCPECAYSNDSVVGLSVHNLYVHSEEAVALRKQEEKEIRAARRAATREAARAAAARDAAATASSNTADTRSAYEMIDLTGDEPVHTTTAQRPAKRKRDPSSSPAPVSTPVSSPAVQAPTPRRVLSREEQDAQDANAEASNAFLAQQMAARDALSPEKRNQVGLTHRERKKHKEKERKAAARARKSQ